MGASLPGPGPPVNRPEGHGGQTKVGGLMDRGRVDGRGARGHAARMVTRERLLDPALFAFAIVAGAALFSNQARRGALPGWALALGTLGGLAACGALWVRRRWPVAVTVGIL